MLVTIMFILGKICKKIFREIFMAILNGCYILIKVLSDK